jgi:hypothetical protein
MSTRDIQIGGTHYKDFAIEPVNYITKNELDWYTGNIVKYASRYKLKGGADDIKKVIHYALMLLEDKYDIKSNLAFLDAAVPVKRKRKRKHKSNSANGTPTDANNTTA